MTKNPEIDISVHCDDWPEVTPLAKRSVHAVYEKTDTNAEISIVLADNAFIQELNKNYRDKDKPTNVLSFPQDHPDNLGDVILALETIQDEARTQNKSFEDHLTHLIIHGTLHLLGYDHENDEEAEEMEKLEIQILEGLGIKNPYEIENFMR